MAGDLFSVAPTPPARALTPVAQLRAARARLAKPGAWDPQAYARDAEHRACRPRDPQAVTWSAVTAVIGVSPRGAHPTAALALLQRAVDLPYFATFEAADGRTLDDLLAAFDRAIALADERVAA